jgi:hypothetical protein
VFFKGAGEEVKEAFKYYSRGNYICNVTGDTFRVEKGVWHCARSCNYDVCPWAIAFMANPNMG